MLMKKLEYLLVKFFYLIFCWIPFSLSYYFAKFFAFFINYIIRYRKNLVKKNLKIAFPRLNKKELRQIVNGVYYNFAYFVVELLQGWRLTEEFFNKNFTIHNWNMIEDALSENKGLILLTGHLANPEWIGSYICSRIANVYAVMKPFHNPYLNNFIIKIRKNLGFKLLYTKEAYKKGLAVLRSKGALALIADQDVREKGIFVSFFGIPSSTPKGVAVLHLKTGAPMVAIVSARRNWGKFDLYCERVPSCQDFTLNKKNVFAVAQAYTSILEKWIRKHPEQYLWLHKRWKTKPNEKQLEEFLRHLYD
jgi:KDO2-lipid IV(A) lauroyltransferase